MIKTKYIKNTTLKILLLSILSLNILNATQNQNKPASKSSLLIKASDNNVKAMQDLNKYYFFLHTKEGLKYYKKWFISIQKNKNPEDILEFAKILKRYEDLFINGERKYVKLLELAKIKGSKNASFELLKYYGNNMIGDKKLKQKFKNIKDEILKDKSKENLLKLKKTLIKIRQWKLAKEITFLMEEKAYIDTNLENRKELDEAYRKSKYVGYDKDRLPNIVNKIIESNSIDDMYYASKEIKHRENILREKLLNKILELSEDKNLKAKVYFDLADTKKRRQKQLVRITRYLNKKLKKTSDEKEKKELKSKIEKYNKEKEAITKQTLIDFYEKASNLDNLKANKELYYIYNREISKYRNDYFRIIKKLKSTDKGLKFYIERFPYDAKLFDKLAKKGDKDIIVRLAKQNLNNKRADLENLARKYRYVILNSKDYELHLKMKETLKSYSYKYSKKAKAYLKKLEEKEKTWDNIFILREKIKEADQKRDYKNKIKYLEIAKSYGDIKSTLSLANTLKSKGYSWEYQKDKEQIKKDILRAISIYEELSQKGELTAKNKLAKIYSSKDFMDKNVYDLKKALKYYEELASLGDLSVLREMIKIYKCKKCEFYNKKTLIKKLEYALKLSKKEIYAKELAMIYYKKGEYQDLAKAKKYFEISKSYYYLARLYYDKDAIEINPKKAFSYIKKCAHLDSSQTRCNYLIGIFYRDGNGVKKDINKAVQHLYSASYDNYFTLPAFELAKIFEEHKEYKRASEVYVRVAKYYKKEALEDLERLYKKSLIPKKVLEDLLPHYERDYKLAFSDYQAKKAASCLSFIYKRGIGVKKDLVKAKEWEKKSI